MHPVFRIATTLALAGVLLGCFTTSPNVTGRSISIERSSCYGRCPVYRFTMYSNGEYVWQGRAHVSVVGVRRGWMGARTFAKAMQLLTDSGYLDFKDSYQSGGGECEIFATDNPTVVIVVADPVHPKRITHYLGCTGFARQEVLTELEDNLDAVFETRKFTG
jgi:hypothetical protein